MGLCSRQSEGSGHTGQTHQGRQERGSLWPEEQQNVLGLGQNRARRPSQGPAPPLHPGASPSSTACTHRGIYGKPGMHMPGARTHCPHALSCHTLLNTLVQKSN